MITLRKSILSAVLLIPALAFQLSAGEGVTAAQVENALKAGAEAALRNLPAYRQSSNLGYRVVCVMALLNAGVPRNHPDVENAIESILRQSDATGGQYQGSYQCGLVNMLLAMLKDPAHRRVAERQTMYLRSYQNADGGWGDFSRTQFALLGLKCARDMGIDVPADCFKKARRYLEQGQNADGGWGYTPGSKSSYGSMTTAGVSSLFITNEQNYKESPVCGAVPNDEAMQKAMKWLGDRFTVKENPNHGGYHYYYLYALERIGVLTGQKYIGGRDWYREGAEYLVRMQALDGSWQRGGLLGTEFALLFLGKGREPVVMQKLMYNGDWNTDPYDAKDLVEQASRDLKLPMSTQIVSTKADVATLSAAPILYLQGRRAFSFDKATREAIKTFVDQGGFVFASNCCATGEFDKSFRNEMSEMFPDAAFEKLPMSHEVFNLHHRITLPNAFMIEGLNTGCRTAVLYAPHDICCAWGGCKGCKDKLCLAGLESKHLGVNMIAYALNFKKLKDKLDNDLIIGKLPSGTTQRNALIIGQLHHTGDWNPDPSAIPNLAQTLKKEIGMQGEVAKRQVILGTDELGDFPLLYLTGHRGFLYSPSQVDALRTYLDRGGFLLADPCCGKVEFDVAFRRLCEQLYPDRPLAPLPASHSVMQQPFNLEKIDYKPAVLKLFPALAAAPQLEGISAPDGRLQIFYSRFNLGCELQGHTCANCMGVSGTHAYNIAVNAIHYALSH
ncbi:MAG TPA: DUF4159 domain-containing protein [Planctomycetota bacterium]|nr:DUF4159 domain-containing protein [Planctomycetota bacterium]